MAEGGINIYPGYTGILCLYHHITKHVIVQWTGLDGVDQQVKLDTEDNLLSFFKATVDVSNEDEIDNRSVDGAIELNSAPDEKLVTESPIVEGNTSDRQIIEKVESNSPANSAATSSIDAMKYKEPVAYKPTDMDMDVLLGRVDEVCKQPYTLGHIPVIEDSVPAYGVTRSSELNAAVTSHSLQGVTEPTDLMNDAASTSAAKVCLPAGEANESTEKRGHQCTVCSKIFSTNNCLKRHMLCHKDIERFQCGICNSQFKQRAHIDWHMLIHTKTTRHPCNVCGKQFNRNCDLTRHMNQAHSKDKSHECSFCDKRFEYEYELIRHIVSHHPATPTTLPPETNIPIKCVEGRIPFTTDQSNQCTVCGIVISNRGNMQRHMLSHPETKSFKCTLCVRRFTSEATLNSHMSVHTTDQPYQCTHCDKRFSYMYKMKLHMTIHSGEKPYPCPICAKPFRLKRFLTIHMSVHTADKPHECTICGKCYRCRTLLIRHRKTHTKDNNPSLTHKHESQKAFKKDT